MDINSFVKYANYMANAIRNSTTGNKKGRTSIMEKRESLNTEGRIMRTLRRRCFSKWRLYSDLQFLLLSIIYKKTLFVFPFLCVFLVNLVRFKIFNSTEFIIKQKLFCYKTFCLRHLIRFATTPQLYNLCGQHTRI